MFKTASFFFEASCPLYISYINNINMLCKHTCRNLKQNARIKILFLNIFSKLQFPAGK